MILGQTTEITIDIPAGSDQEISSGFILGFGPAIITVIAADAEEEISGLVLGPFVL
jgi:hypothetical protein